MSEKQEADVIQEVQEFLSKVDGVEAFVVSREGFPVAYSGRISQEEAEAITALAVDLSEASAITLQDLGAGRPREIVVQLESGEAISVGSARDLLLALKGPRGPIEVALAQAIRGLRGERVTCPYCGADLTLEVVKCPSCGRSVPFSADSCPFCGADLRFKPCPKCGRTITSDGRKVVFRRDPRAKLLAGLDGVLGGVIGAILGYLGTSSIAWALGLGAVIGALLGYGIYMLAPVHPEIEKGEG